jgi:hypothetical protein
VKPISALCTILVLVGGGFTAYKVLNSKPQPLTLAECREAAKNSDEVRKYITAYGYKDADKQSVIAAVAIRCFVDRDAETYSWSNDQKIQLVAHRFCSSRASEAMAGDDVAVQTYRMAFQASCEAAMIERTRTHK